MLFFFIYRFLLGYLYQAIRSCLHRKQFPRQPKQLYVFNNFTTVDSLSPLGAIEVQIYSSLSGDSIVYCIFHFLNCLSFFFFFY